MWWIIILDYYKSAYNTFGILLLYCLMLYWSIPYIGSSKLKWFSIFYVDTIYQNLKTKFYRELKKQESIKYNCFACVEIPVQEATMLKLIIPRNTYNFHSMKISFYWPVLQRSLVSEEIHFRGWYLC